MVRISESQIYINSSPNAVSQGEQFNNCLWETYNNAQSSETQNEYNPEESAKELMVAIKNKDFSAFKKIIESTAQNKLQHLMNAYRMITSISILDALEKVFKDKPGTNEIESKLRSFGHGTYAHAEILAHDLMKELNGSNTEKIDKLMNELKELSPDRVEDIYAFYQHRAIYTTKNESDLYKQEIAATDAEKKELGADADGILEKILSALSFNHVKIRTQATRPETLFQGILNNPTLALDKKKEYLRIVSNKLVEYAKKKNIPDNKIKDYQNKANYHIESAADIDNPNGNNTLGLEKALAELLGFKGNRK